MQESSINLECHAWTVPSCMARSNLDRKGLVTSVLDGERAIGSGDAYFVPVINQFVITDNLN